MDQRVGGEDQEGVVESQSDMGEDAAMARMNTDDKWRCHFHFLKNSESTNKVELGID